jgi:hypothetical protein
MTPLKVGYDLENLRAIPYLAMLFALDFVNTSSSISTLNIGKSVFSYK